MPPRRLQILDDNRHQWSWRNGLDIVYQRWPEPSADSNLMLIIRLKDSISTKQQGLAHLTEHIVARFLQSRLSSGEPQVTLEDAYTDTDGVYFSASASNELVPQVIVAFNAVFQIGSYLIKANDFERARQEVLTELSQLASDPHDLVKIRLNQLVWPNSPSGIDPGGVPEFVEEVQREQVIDYFERV